MVENHHERTSLKLKDPASIEAPQQASIRVTDFGDGNIDVAIMKELYANLYDPEDK